MGDMFNLGLIDEEDDDDLPYVMEEVANDEGVKRYHKLKDLHGQWSAEIGRLKSSNGPQGSIDSAQRKVDAWAAEMKALKAKHSIKEPGDEEEKKPEAPRPQSSGQHSMGAPAQTPAHQHSQGAPAQQKPASSVPQVGAPKPQQQGQQQNQQKPQQQGQQQNQQKPQQHPHGHQQDRKSRAVAAVQKAIDTHNKKGFLTRWWTHGATKKKIGKFVQAMDKHGDNVNSRISKAEKDEQSNRDLAARKKREAEAHDAHAKKAWWGSTVHRAQAKAAAARKAQSEAGESIKKSQEERNKWRGVQGRHGADREEVRRRLKNARLMDSFDVELACQIAEEINARRGYDLDEGALNDLAWKVGGAIAPSTARNRARRLAGEYKQASKTPIKGSGAEVGAQFAKRRENKKKANELLHRATTQFKGRKENTVDRIVKNLGLRKKATQDPWKDRRKGPRKAATA